MPRLIDRSGRVVNVDADEVSGLLAQGYVPVSEEQYDLAISVADPDFAGGFRVRTGQVGGDNLLQALQDPNISIRSRQNDDAVLLSQHQQRLNETRRERSPFLGAAIGVVDTMTLGHADAISPMSREELNLISEAHSGANTLGRVGADVGAIIATGGLAAAAGRGGMLARYAGMALSPGAAAGVRAGVAVERAVMGAAGGARGARLGSLLARGATEGAIQGAAMAVTEANMQDAPIAAEKLMAEAGLGAMLGFGVELGVEGLARVLRGSAVGLGARAARSDIQRAADQTIESLGPESLSWFQRFMSRGQGVVAGVDIANVNGVNLKSARAGELIGQIHEGIPRIIRAATDNLNALEEQVAQLRRGVLDAKNFGELSAVKQALKESVSEEGARIAREGFRRAGTGLRESLEARALDLPASARNKLQEAAGLIDQIHGTGGRKFAPGGGASTESLFRDGLRVRDRIRALIGETRDPTAQGLLREAEAGLGNVLFDENAFGRAARMFKDRAKAVEVIDDRMAALDALRTATGEPGVRKFDAGKLEQKFRNWGDPAGDQVLEQLTSFFEAMEPAGKLGFLKELGDVPAAREIENIAGATRAVFQKDAELIRVANAVRIAMRRETSAAGFNVAAGFGAGAIAGSLFAGAPGVLAAIALGGLWGSLARPTAAAVRKANLKKALSSIAERFAKGKESFGKAITSGTLAARKGASAAGASVVFKLRDHKQREEAYLSIVERVRELQADPQTRMELAQLHSLSTIDYPTVSSLLAQNQEIGLRWLAEHLPQPLIDPLSGQPLGMTPSNSDIDAVLAYMEVLDNPLAVWDFINTNTLTQPHVEALAAVYPNTHQAFVEAVYDELAKAQAKAMKKNRRASAGIPYQTRLTIATLVGGTLDPTLEPDFMAVLQTGATQTAQQAEVQGPRPSSARLSFSQSTMTEAQSLELDR